MNNTGKVFRTMPVSGLNILISNISYYFTNVKIFKHPNHWGRLKAIFARSTVWKQSLTEIWHINCLDYFEKPLFTLSLFSLSKISFPSITNGSRSFNRDYLLISGSQHSAKSRVTLLSDSPRWAANISLGQRHLYQAKNELQSTNSKTRKIHSNRNLNHTIPGPQRKTTVKRFH